MSYKYKKCLLIEINTAKIDVSDTSAQVDNLKVFILEIQHAIQEYEGFVPESTITSSDNIPFK